MDPNWEWVIMYTGRPDRPRPMNRTSQAELEQKEAMDYLDANSHMTLEELAADNYQKQYDKELEYHRLKNKKAPTLDEQQIGPDGRYIFSQEYIDFMLYKELQPLIDLRVLRYGEAIINQRKAARDAAAKTTTTTEEKCQKDPSTAGPSSSTA